MATLNRVCGGIGDAAAADGIVVSLAAQPAKLTTSTRVMIRLNKQR